MSAVHGELVLQLELVQKWIAASSLSLAPDLLFVRRHVEKVASASSLRPALIGDGECNPPRASCHSRIAAEMTGCTPGQRDLLRCASPARGHSAHQRVLGSWHDEV